MAERPSKGTIEAGHELSSANTRGIFWFILCFVLTMGAIHLLLWGTLGGLNRHEVKREAGASPIGETRPRELDQALQPAPGHPTLPSQDLAAMKAEQLSRLHSYGPAEGDAKFAHIPIEKAMEMLLESGQLKKTVKGAETQPFINQTQPAPTENRT